MSATSSKHVFVIVITLIDKVIKLLPKGAFKSEKEFTCLSEIRYFKITWWTFWSSVDFTTGRVQTLKRKRSFFNFCVTNLKHNNYSLFRVQSLSSYFIVIIVQQNMHDNSPCHRKLTKYQVQLISLMSNKGWQIDQLSWLFLMPSELIRDLRASLQPLLWRS